MTYCFIFCAGFKGGIGIVADRRVSVETKFDGIRPLHDEAVKVAMLNSEVGVVFAGTNILIHKILDKLMGHDLMSNPSGRREKICEIIPIIYQKLVQDDVEFRNSSDNASLVFFDTYKSRGNQKYRLLKIEVKFNPEKVRCEIGRSLKKSSYISIGATQEIRRYIDSHAIIEMQQFLKEPISLKVTKNYESLTASSDAVGLLMERGKGSPPYIEAEYNRLYEEIGEPASRIDYTSLLVIRASHSIQFSIEALKKERRFMIDGVSLNLSCASYHSQYGLQLNFLSPNNGLGN